MSGVSIAPYFPFRRIKIINQSVLADATEARIEVKPDKRFQPVCHFCGQKASGVHSWGQRTVRDLNLASAKVWITCQYRKLFCPHCQHISIEDLELFHPYLRVTTRLALYIYQLCRFMTVTEVAKHLGLDWKTVKNIDKFYLEGQFGQPNLDGLRILAVDEISVKKGHRYLTVVMDYFSGRVVFVGKDRKTKTLKGFFNQLTAAQRKSIEAVVMDMWDPFIKAVKKNCLRPKSSLICSMWWPSLTASLIKCETVNIAKPLNKTRRSLKVLNTCLLKNRKNIRHQSQRAQLRQLLQLNQVINTVMILKEQLKRIWSYRSRSWSTKAFDYWCGLAKSLNHPALNSFAKMLNRYRYGILNHCDYPIHTGKLEGVNNKIKVIKRKAYGFHDLRYFTLKIYQAFYN